MPGHQRHRQLRCFCRIASLIRRAGIMKLLFAAAATIDATNAPGRADTAGFLSAFIGNAHVVAILPLGSPPLFAAAI